MRGFVAIYERLAREAALTVKPFHVYAKGFDYVDGQSTKKNNHAWLAVRVDGRWGLVDPTCRFRRRPAGHRPRHLRALAWHQSH
jgi:transglutaminase/protease-like cytokinesis protein 3